MRKAVFLDRDGVLNQAIIKNGKPYPPETVTEVIIPNDAKASLTALKQAGYLLLVVTNQPDVARGAVKQEVVEAINEYLQQQLSLDAIYVCYHDDQDNCECRKPLPGLILQAARQWQVDLEKSYMIGDRWKDISSGKAAGCKTLWLCNDYDEQRPEAPDTICRSLTEAKQYIVQTQ